MTLLRRCVSFPLGCVLYGNCLLPSFCQSRMYAAVCKMEAHFESSDSGFSPLQVSAFSGWIFPMIDTGREFLASELSFRSTLLLKLVLSFFQLTIMQFFWFYSQLILQIWKDTFRQKCRYSFKFELSFQLGDLFARFIAAIMVLATDRKMIIMSHKGWLSIPHSC